MGHYFLDTQFWWISLTITIVLNFADFHFLAISSLNEIFDEIPTYKDNNRMGQWCHMIERQRDRKSDKLKQRESDR